MPEEEEPITVLCIGCESEWLLDPTDLPALVQEMLRVAQEKDDLCPEDFQQLVLDVLGFEDEEDEDDEDEEDS